MKEENPKGGFGMTGFLFRKVICYFTAGAAGLHYAAPFGVLNPHCFVWPFCNALLIYKAKVLRASFSGRNGLGDDFFPARWAGLWYACLSGREEDS